MRRDLANSLGRRFLFGMLVAAVCLYLIPLPFPLRAGQQAGVDEIDTLFQAANDLFVQRQYRTALNTFRLVLDKIERAPDRAEREESARQTQLIIAHCHFELAERDLAKAAFIDYLKRIPDLDEDPVLFSEKIGIVYGEAKAEYRAMLEQKAKDETAAKEAERAKAEAARLKEEARVREEARKEEEKKRQAAALEEAVKKEAAKISEAKPAEEKKEQPQPKPVVKTKAGAADSGKKKGRFPWLIAGGLVVGGAAAALLLGKRSSSSGNGGGGDSPGPSKPTTGSIQLNSTPTGAKAYLDGVERGATPLSISNVSVGSHPVKLVLDLYGKWEGSVTVQAGQTATVNATLAAFKYEYRTEWGGSGYGDGKFSRLNGIAVGSSGNVYVADQNRIQKFTSSGGYLIKWGSSGSGNGEFYGAQGVAVDNLGNIYALDFGNYRIQKFTPNGKFLAKWGSRGYRNGQFIGPLGIAADQAGNIYVSDYQNNQVQKFNSNGDYVCKFGKGGIGGVRFRSPLGLAIDRSGNIYVADCDLVEPIGRIQKFSPVGDVLATWDTWGRGNGQFIYPVGIAIDRSDYAYVVDRDNNCIQKFTLEGKFVTKWGTGGVARGQFDWPWGVAINSAGDVYVADSRNLRIQKFRITDQTEPQVGAAVQAAPSINTLRLQRRFGLDRETLIERRENKERKRENK